MRATALLPFTLVALLPSLARATPAAVAVDVAVDVDVDVKVRPVEVPAPVIYEPPPPPPPAHPLLTGHRWELGLLFEGGPGFALGDLEGSQGGVRAVLGRQLGPLRLAVEAGVAKLSADRDLYDAMGWWSGWETLEGEVSRLGASVRYRGVLAPHAMPGQLRAAAGAYVELAAGRQRIAWAGGGVIERPDVALGLGVEVGGGRHRMAGFDLGVRFVASPAVESGVACAGVCSQATLDRTHDVGVLFHLGLILGS